MVEQLEAQIEELEAKIAELQAKARPLRDERRRILRNARLRRPENLARIRERRYRQKLRAAGVEPRHH